MSQQNVRSITVAPPHRAHLLVWAGAIFLLLLAGAGVALLVHEWETGAGGTAFLVAAILLVTLFFVLRRVIDFVTLHWIQPLEQVHAAALRMAQGDIATRVGELPQGEIAEVGHALDALADRLQAREAEINAQASALQAADARYQILAEDQTELIVHLAADERLTYVNDAYCRALGIEREQALGRFWFDPMAAQDQNHLRPLLAGLTPEHPVATGQYRIPVADGHDRWHQFMARALYDAEGHLTEISVIARDITEHREIEEALLEVNAGLENHVASRTAELARAQEQVVAAQARLGQLLAAAPAVVYSCEVDKRFPTTFITENVQRLLGYEARRFIENPYFAQEQLHPEDQAWLGDVFDQLVAQGQLNLEYRFKHCDGTYRWLSDELRVIRDENGEPVELVGGFMDITERKEMEQALHESQERYELAVRAANEGLWDWDLDKNRIYYSARWKSILGYGEVEIGDSIAEWYGRVHVQDLPRLQADLEAHLRGNTSHFENEHRIIDGEGHYRWVLTHGMAVCHADGRNYRMVGSMTDITGRKEAEERIIYDALHEPLTGLPNRALFMDRLSQVLKRRGDSEHRAAVFVIDLDRFRVVNDSLGHLHSDRLLVEVGQRFESLVRPTDTVARLGGDEFAVLLDRISSLAEAIATADRIQHALLAPFHIDSREIILTASIGIAMTPADARDRFRPTAADILRGADTAMNRAKSEGRNRYAVYDDSMHAHAMAVLELEGDLRRAIERNEFEVYYQPIFSLADGKTVGAEALVRWRHPEHGLISPDKFITLAEETGLIEPIGDWIFRAACAQTQAWRAQRDPNFQVAVNFSALQFQNPRLVECMEQVLSETGLPPSGLKIEITETTLMRDLAQSRQILHRLDELGIEISIDDFGNSYSALGQLKQLPVKVLKIDQSFLRNVPEDLNNKALTTAIIAMARSLSLRVIAEGVETHDQLHFLHAQGCDEIQGFLFSRPVPPATFFEQWSALDCKLASLIKTKVQD